MLPESKQQHGDQHNGPVALSIEHRRASSQAFKAEDSRPLLSKGSLQGEPNCSSTSEHEHVAGRAEVGPTAEHSQLHTRAGAFLKASKALLGAIWTSGSLCMSLAAITFAFSALFVKLLGGRVPVFEIVVIRSSMSFGICALVARLQTPPMRPFFGHRPNLHLLILRGLCGAIAMSTYYFCLEALPLGDAVTLFFFNPCITAVAAAVFLKEPLGLKGVMGVVTSIGGLVILAHPPFLFGGHEGWGMQRKLGTMFGIISALFAAGAFISIRLIGKGEPALVMSVYFHAFAFSTTVVPLAAGWPAHAVLPNVLDALLLFGVAFTSFFGQVLIGRGFQLLHAAKASAINFTQVIYSWVLGGLFLSERMSLSGVLGAVLIAAGALIINTRDKRHADERSADDTAEEGASSICNTAEGIAAGSHAAASPPATAKLQLPTEERNNTPLPSFSGTSFGTEKGHSVNITRDGVPSGCQMLLELQAVSTSPATLQLPRTAITTNAEIPTGTMHVDANDAGCSLPGLQGAASAAGPAPAASSQVSSSHSRQHALPSPGCEGCSGGNGQAASGRSEGCPLCDMVQDASVHGGVCIPEANTSRHPCASCRAPD